MPIGHDAVLFEHDAMTIGHDAVTPCGLQFVAEDARDGAEEVRRVARPVPRPEHQLPEGDADGRRLLLRLRADAPAARPRDAPLLAALTPPMTARGDPDDGP